MRRSIQYAQNFLRDPRLVTSLVAASSISPNDTVLDIGAGSGSITRALAAKAGHVKAYEADERLATKLVADALATPNVEVIMGDFLASPLPAEAYKVFANIPFNLTSDIVRKLLDGFNPPADCYLIVQREAALKCTGMPGKQSLFSALHGPWSDMTIAHQFKSTDFMPQPKVNVVLLRIVQRATSLINAAQSEHYRDFVSYMFNHANPNILPSLKKLFPGKQFEVIEQALGSKLTAKPSQLEIHDWIAAFYAFSASMNDEQLRLVNGASTKLQNESKQIEKHHRTRSASNWRTTQ